MCCPKTILSRERVCRDAEDIGCLLLEPSCHTQRILIKGNKSSIVSLAEVAPYDGGSDYITPSSAELRPEIQRVTNKHKGRYEIEHPAKNCIDKKTDSVCETSPSPDPQLVIALGGNYSRLRVVITNNPRNHKPFVGAVVEFWGKTLCRSFHIITAEASYTLDTSVPPQPPMCASDSGGVISQHANSGHHICCT